MRLQIDSVDCNNVVKQI